MPHLKVVPRFQQAFKGFFHDCVPRLITLALQVITATPRQLESGVRLAEALARMRLSPTVEPSDVREGLRLMQVGCYPLMQLCRLHPDCHSLEPSAA